MTHTRQERTKARIGLESHMGIAPFPVHRIPVSAQEEEAWLEVEHRRLRHLHTKLMASHARAVGTLRAIQRDSHNVELVDECLRLIGRREV